MVKSLMNLADSSDQKLYLSNDNLLAGEIPTNLSHCSRLIRLDIGENKLVGKIPSEFVSLSNLQILILEKNNLTGGIPYFLGNLTSLEVIAISYNALGGNIPDSLDRLKKLRFHGFSGNNLLGTVPPSLYNLSSLQDFSLSENQLHGSLPSNLGLTLPNLIVFIAWSNFFSGSIPISFSNASQLQVVDMSGNNFSGKLSSIDFGGMQDLKTLFLSRNNLGSGEVDEMNFFNSLANCSNLYALSIGETKLRGVLPRSIATFSTTLEILYLNENQLYGSIPPMITNLVNLKTLDFYQNRFTGPIPKDIDKLHNLVLMDFSDNQLSGEIPSSIGNMSLVEHLYLNYNKLLGAIPSSTGKLKQLSSLDLSQNDLSGIIHVAIFNIPHLSISLNLSQNHLVGSIPSEIGNLKVLTEFDVSNNNLSGEIPNEIGLCSSFEYLNLEGNFFHRSIPSSLNSLRGIRKLDLSCNNLSGQILKFLETLPLEKINLSYNDLEGEVPMKGIFTNESAVSIVGNVVILGLPMMSSFIFCWVKKRTEGQASKSTLEKSLLKVSYEMLLKATDGFSPTHLIGVGSFGSVYKGILEPDGTIVAVKVLNLLQQGASKSFMAECKALKNIRHRNLVKVITSCSITDFRGNDFKAIVYEFMANGSLEKWLPPAEELEEQNKSQSLTILQRISIAIDVAFAVEYLHQHCEEQVLHCDLKPNNVL
ncbi:hypothetical protein LWI28_014654 [Acer negundo]|uniref:non-specific serine/threonine protein kinase n=1 Tax=Acer negundo TaxID=4023 RepID=A0AAD5IAR3_ACENE|nr:hypothetical protein LWI28_014654 [Acer negundo]